MLGGGFKMMGGFRTILLGLLLLVDEVVGSDNLTGENTHCVPVTFLRSRGKFMSGDTFQGGAFFSSEGRFFFFRGALFFLQRGSFWSVEYAEKKSGGHRPP